MSLFKDMDMQAISKNAKEFNMKYLALRVLNGQKQVNYKTNSGKNILEKLIEHGKNNDVKMLASVLIAGGDVQVEFNKLVGLISNFVKSGDLYGLVIEVSDTWSKRTSAEAKKYIKLVRTKWPTLPIILLDTTTGNINMSTWASLVDQIIVLCTWVGSSSPSSSIVEEYLRYWNSGLWKTYEKLDYVFTPALGICNIKTHSYIFKSAKFEIAYNWILNSSKFNACMFYDWTPVGEAGLGDDGSSIDKTIRTAIWTKGIVEVEEPVEDPIEDPVVEEDYSFTEERFKEIYKWYKTQ
jgi:hypothetical protein